MNKKIVLFISFVVLIVMSNAVPISKISPNSQIYVDNITFRINVPTNYSFEECYLNFAGAKYNMTKINDRTCEYNLSFSSIGDYVYLFYGKVLDNTTGNTSNFTTRLYTLVKNNLLNNMTFKFQILINNYNQNISFGKNYSIKLFDANKGLVVLKEDGSTRAWANDKGEILLTNTSINPFQGYYLIVYDDKGQIIKKRFIYITKRYFSIWINNNDEGAYPFKYSEIIKTTFALPFLFPILYAFIVFSFIKLYKFGTGLMFSGLVILLFSVALWSYIPEDNKILLLGFAVVSIIVGFSATKLTNTYSKRNR